MFWEAGFAEGLGRPVITSDQPSLGFIRENNLGVLVKHPLEIGDAVVRILDKEEEMHRNCVAFAQDHLTPAAWERPVRDLMRELVDGK